MGEFIFGIISSLVVELIVFIILKLIKSVKIKYSIAKFLLKQDYFPYKNQKYALDDIKNDAQLSREIRILSIRGLSYIGEDGDFSFIWSNVSKRIEIVISDLCNDSVKKRSAIYKENKEKYIKEMEEVQNFILDKKKVFEHLSYYNHKEDLVFRLIILEKQMYVSFFIAGKKASDSQVYRFDRDSQMYKAFLTYYKNVRRKSKKV